MYAQIAIDDARCRIPCVSRPSCDKCAAGPGLDPVLREKLVTIDDGVLADVILNLILTHRSIDAVVPAMMQLDHLERNVAAVTRSRFSPDELSHLHKRIAQADK